MSGDPPIRIPTEYVVGIDAGGTQSTVVVAKPDGREVLRRTGPAARFDPREPGASACVIVELTRAAVATAGLDLPAPALCAGVAGAGGRVEREALRDILDGAELAHRVTVVSDGEIALEGALPGAPGIVLVAGTGSIAFGRAEDGRTERNGHYRVGDSRGVPLGWVRTGDVEEWKPHSGARPVRRPKAGSTRVHCRRSWRSKGRRAIAENTGSLLSP
jgi:N-acetylglucosamine kinase-like BadF-type ATPase